MAGRPFYEVPASPEALLPMLSSHSKMSVKEMRISQVRCDEIFFICVKAGVSFTRLSTSRSPPAKRARE
jgi:hypothetical protein